MEFKVLFVLIFIVKQYVSGLPVETSQNNMDRFFIPHIIGGSDAPQGYAPYMAAILIGDAFVMVACGGSIVLPNLILTAAHCIDVYQVPGGLMETFHAVVGSNNFKSGGITVYFERYHIHPKWDSAIMKNDIGFLVLNKKLQTDENMKPVALNMKWVSGEEPSIVTGWGLIATRPAITPHNLQILEVNTLSPQECVDAVREASEMWWPQAPLVDPTLEICSLNSDGGGLCYGDSGSPLVSKKTGAQIGIVSWAFPCAAGVPDMHVRLSAFEEYIQSIVGEYQ